MAQGEPLFKTGMGIEPVLSGEQISEVERELINTLVRALRNLTFRESLLEIGAVPGSIQFPAFNLQRPSRLPRIEPTLDRAQ